MISLNKELFELYKAYVKKHAPVKEWCIDLLCIKYKIKIKHNKLTCAASVDTCCCWPCSVYNEIH